MYRRCPYCAKLHVVSGSESPTSREQRIKSQGRNPSRLCQSRYRIAHKLTLGYRLEWFRVQLALKRHHYGPSYGIPLSRLEYTSSLPPSDSITGNIKARVINDELYLRTTTVLDIPYMKTRLQEGLPSVTVCNHCRVSPHIGTEFMTAILCQLESTSEERCRYCIELKQCNLCCTEWRVDRLSADKMSITSWHCFGKGQTPYDGRWTAQDSGLHYYQISRVEFIAGSIQKARSSQDKDVVRDSGSARSIEADVTQASQFAYKSRNTAEQGDALKEILDVRRTGRLVKARMKWWTRHRDPDWYRLKDLADNKELIIDYYTKHNEKPRPEWVNAMLNPEMGDSQEWEVQKIIDVKRVGRGFKVQAKWKGHEDLTWHPIQDFEGSKELLIEFYQKDPKEATQGVALGDRFGTARWVQNFTTSIGITRAQNLRSV